MDFLENEVRKYMEKTKKSLSSCTLLQERKRERERDEHRKTVCKKEKGKECVKIGEIE